MKEYIDALKKQIANNPPNLDGSESVLEFLYEAYSQVNRMDDARIKANFHALYQAMNGMTLQEMDQILDPVCALCRDHERGWFCGRGSDWSQTMEGVIKVSFGWCVRKRSDRSIACGMELQILHRFYTQILQTESSTKRFRKISDRRPPRCSCRYTRHRRQYLL